MELSPSAGGLTIEEARQLRAMGRGNAPPPPITKTTGQIIREHVCTRFNLFNVLIAASLALVGAWSNLLFILIIALNTVIGIVQELHAKKQVERISVLTAPRVRVLRDGALRDLPVEELVLRDVISLESGMQVPADARVLSGELELDESLLTGESEPVRKGAGAGLLSGSVVVSGTCSARVERVGADNYAQKIAGDAGYIKKRNSEIMDSIDFIVKIIGFAILPIGGLLFWKQYFVLQDTFQNSVVSTAAAMVGRCFTM